MAQYDRFAVFYDQVMGDREETAREVRSLIRRANPRARSLLELGCGTGGLLTVLSEHYRVAGIDLSQEMLRRARKKVPAARFYRQDISRFRIDDRFDAIIAIFDTLNHLLSFSRWEALFERVRAHLTAKGVFIFDINTERKLERYSSELPYAEVHENGVSVIEVAKAGRGRYRLDARFFAHKRGSTYALFEDTIQEIAVPTERIRRALRRHFEIVTLYDPARPRASARSEELYFICRRPR